MKFEKCTGASPARCCGAGLFGRSFDDGSAAPRAPASDRRVSRPSARSASRAPRRPASPCRRARAARRRSCAPAPSGCCCGSPACRLDRLGVLRSVELERDADLRIALGVAVGEVHGERVERQRRSAGRCVRVVAAPSLRATPDPARRPAADSPRLRPRRCLAGVAAPPPCRAADERQQQQRGRARAAAVSSCPAERGGCRGLRRCIGGVDGSGGSSSGGPWIGIMSVGRRGPLFEARPRDAG